MPMLTHPTTTKVADIADVVAGVDTHRDTHTLELVTAAGLTLAACQIPNTSAGYAQVLTWISDHTHDDQHVVVGIEGTGSYGKALTRALLHAGVQVADIPRARRADPRRGKSDPIDAHTIALTTLATDLDQLAAPRADGDREALRILLAARTDLTGAATAATNRVKDLLRAGDDTDRDTARSPLSQATLTHLTRRRPRHGETRVEATRRTEITRLTRHLLNLGRDLATNKATLTEIVTDLADGLLDLTGVGPVTAATALAAYSHPGRVRNDAAYAALAGTSPIPASSGQTTRHRLNRGGDRALNSAIHTITLTRTRCCPRTHAYITRRRAEGKTDREIRRCLKRYITRELYRKITAAMT